MDHIRYFQVKFIAFVILFMFGRECRSYCEIDFHMESPALMLLQGQNSSVLCDATCFAGQGPVDLFWTDAHNNRIRSIPNSVFAVRYNRGLMNRLIIIGASGSKSGPYVCSVMRSGVLLDQRAINVVVLGDNGNLESHHRPADTGPRRGDMTPRRDLDYRPVRSVPQEPSYPLVGRMIFDLHKKDNELQRHEYSKHHQIWGNIQHDNTNGVISEERKSLTKQNLGSIIDNNLKPEPIRNYDIQVVDRSIDETEKNKEITSQEKTEKISDISNTDIRKMGQSLNLLSAIKGNKVTKPRKVINELLQVRMKRENTKTTLESPTKDAENTTKGNITIVTSRQLYAEYSNVFNSTDTIDGKSTTPSSNLSNGTTKVISTFSTSKYEDSNKDTQDGSGRPDEDDDGPDSSLFPVEKVTCADGPREESTFGSYGVLAFAVSLAIVLLLVYAVIMILCMPRMMAMRRGRLDVKGAAFKKEGPNNAETAALTILDGVDTAEVDLNEVKSDTANQDKPLTSDSSLSPEKKESDTPESPATVSSFLIGHEAQKKAEDETNKNTNDIKEDSSKSGDTTDKSSSKPEAETTPNSEAQPDQSDAIKLENEKGDKQLESLELSSELLSIILPELTIPGSAEVKGQIEVNCQNHAVSEAGDVSTSDHVFEKDSNPDRQSLANPPAPPPEEIEELNRVTLV